MSQPASETPMMRQFHDAKRQHPDKILFFRMGDFYEMFGDDAVKAAPILQIALTSRNKQQEGAIPMCGVPCRAYESYLNRLTAAGYKVAICEQTEDPAKVKGLVNREIVRIVTPGTTVSPELLPPDDNHYLVALLWQVRPAGIGLARADLSTGELEITEFEESEKLVCLDFLRQLQPGEVLLPEARTEGEVQFVQSVLQLLKQLPKVREQAATIRSAYDFDEQTARQRLLEHFGTLNLAGFGIEGLERGIRAAGALLQYMGETQQCSLSHLTSIRKLQRSQMMPLDETTIRNLEIFESPTGHKRHTLFNVLNQCVTPMGARQLRQWLRYPLLNQVPLEARYDAIEEFQQLGRMRQELRQQLAQVQDLPRIAGRISLPVAGMSDFLALRSSLGPLQLLPELLVPLSTPLLVEVGASFDPLSDLLTLLEQQLLPEPSLKLAESGYIADGVSQELDELRLLTTDSKEFLNQMLQQERERTGIVSLKLGFNKVFGYYLEVSNTHKNRVPSYYFRKQTLSNGERYITEELKEFEEKILSAEERSVELEQALFAELRQEVLQQLGRLQESARKLAILDVLAGWAELALASHYVRPRLLKAEQPRQLRLQASRHPVIEQLDLGEPFVPNDIDLEEENRRVLLITGPNMAGKSTFMRQVALNVLMAQSGCFVAASAAEMTLVDRIFTRVGASDNLSQGQSTFMVEMNEAAAILNNASEHSLIVLDEIGRGTSTFDGISIAWAIIEHLYELGSLTLCATHYHELTELAQQLAGVVNASVCVEEEGERILFLRKIGPGEADKSYGVQVARLAGLPSLVIQRAQQILQTLEQAHTLRHVVQEPAPVHDNRIIHQEATAQEPFNGSQLQLSLFAEDSRLVEELRALNLSQTTPLEALNLLHDLQQRLQ
jgi:DNA mismatch repair protein MutS